MRVINFIIENVSIDSKSHLCNSWMEKSTRMCLVKPLPFTFSLFHICPVTIFKFSYAPYVICAHTYEELRKKKRNECTDHLMHVYAIFSLSFSLPFICCPFSNCQSIEFYHINVIESLDSRHHLLRSCHSRMLH